MILRILIIFVFVFLSSPVGAANVYIDPYWSGTESGTCAEPYNSWTDIAFSASNDYYQKCDTIENITSSIQIDNITGSSSNRVIIGAFYESGGNCIIGVSGAKPILNRNNTSGTTFNPRNSTYLQFENLDLRGGESTLFLQSSSDNAIIKDCNVGLNSNNYGIRIWSSDSGEAFNNIVDSNSQVSGTGLTDGINVGSSSDDWKVYKNKIYNWRHSQIAIGSYSDNNDIYNNYAEGTECDSDNPCRGVEILNQAAYNLVHHNYFYNFNQHSQVLKAAYNRIFYNVWDTTRSPATDTFLFQVYSSTDVINNKFYNNLIYNSNGYSILFYITAGETGTITGNEIVNNIFLEWGNDTAGIKISNNENIFTNTFKNNLYFSSGDSTIVNYRNSQLTLAQWLNENGNAYGEVISNELNSSPSLKNPSNGQFWPDDAGDDVVGNGCDMNDSGSDCYDAGYAASESILFYTTDFTASPPDVDLDVQPASWYIGAYSLEELVDTTDPVVTISTDDPSNIGEDTLAIAGTVSDAGGVQSCKFRIGDPPDATNGELITVYETFPLSWDGTATGFEIGANTLYVGCDDPTGNWGSSSIVVNLSGTGVTRLMRVGGDAFSLGN